MKRSFFLASNIKPLAGAFTRDVIWNLASFAIIALAGLLFHILIARVYGPAPLGTFNQAIALYIVFSQLSTAGFHLAILQRVSVLAAAPPTEANRASLHTNISTAILSVAVIAFIIVSLGYVSSGLVGRIFNSESVRMAWLYILPGLWFFSLNKALLNVVNGLRHMIAFAIGQAARYILMLIGLLIFIVLGVDGDKLTLVVTLTEAVLFAALIMYLFRHYPMSWRLFDLDLAGNQFFFGLRGLWGNTLTDLNTRVDIIILGIFSNDKVVGVYTLASTIFDGIYYFLVVLRNIFNPYIAAFFDKRKFAEFRAQWHRVSLVAYAGSVLIGLGAIAIYPFFVDWVVGDPSFHEGLVPLVILVTGLCLVAGWLPLDMLLIQAGDPTAQSLLKAGTVMTNIVLASLFVPFFGMPAAAAASVAALALSVLWLKLLARHRLGVRL